MTHARRSTNAWRISAVATFAAAAWIASAPLTCAAAEGSARIGSGAPDFVGTDSNGKSVALKDLHGRVVVLEWSNNQCPFVGKHYRSGNMQSLQKEATGEGVVWLTILSSASGEQGNVTAAEANELTRSRGLATPMGRAPPLTCSSSTRTARSFTWGASMTSRRPTSLTSPAPETTCGSLWQR
jgi:hypothetical protein